MPPLIPGFRLLHSIGRGAYGEVWLGQDVVLGVYRAIKIVWLQHETDRTSLEKDSRKHRAERVLRGLQEYLQRVSVLSFPAIAILELKVDPAGRFFHYTMPLADDARTGRELNPLELPIEGYQPLTLSSLCAAQPNACLPPKTVVRIGTRLAEALSELHAANIVHQDIKPANIIFLRGEPIYADVDLIRDLDATRTIAGTPGYVAPEGSGTTAADLYALGKTLYVMATGLSAQNRSLTPAGDWDRVPEANLLGDLMQIWSRACEDRPALRHETADELCAELRLLEAGRSIQQLRRLERFKKRSQRIAFIGVPLVLTLIALAVFLQKQARIQEFALYQASMARAVSNLNEGRLGLARKALLDPTIPVLQRGPEWHALWYQTKGPVVVSFNPSTNKVDRLVFSPDGRRLAIEVREGLYVEEFRSKRVRPGVLRSIRNGEDLFTQEITGTTNRLFLPDVNVIGGWLDYERFIGTAIASNGRPVRVWNIKDPKHPIEVYDGSNWISGPRSRAGAFAFVNLARPGEIAVGTSLPLEIARWKTWGHPAMDDTIRSPIVDETGHILLQRVDSGEGDNYISRFFIKNLTNDLPPLQFDFQLVDPQAWALSPDGLSIVYSEAKTGDLVLRTGPQFGKVASERFNAIRALAFSPDGAQLATGGEDEQVRIHDARSLQVLRTFQGHYAPIESLTWSEDGKHLASGDRSGHVNVWDLDAAAMEWDVVSGLKAGGIGVMIVPEPLGPSLAVSSTNRTTALINAETLQKTHVYSGGHTPLQFEHNWLWMIAGGTNGLLREALGLGIRERFELQGTKDDVIGMLSKSEDKAVLYESSGNQVLCLSWPPTSPLRFAQKHGGNYINDVAISSFGSNAVSVGDGVATLWNTSWNLPVQTISLPGEIYSVAFVPSSEKCLIGADGYRIHRLDGSSGRWLGTWQSLLEHNYAIVIDPDSDRFFTGGGSGRIHVGRLSDGKPLVVLEHPELRQRKGEHRIRRLAYNPLVKDLYAMTDGGILARWRMAPEPEPY